MGRSRKESKRPPLKKKQKEKVSAKKHKTALKIGEQCNEKKFLNYDEIKEYICKIEKNYPQRIQIQVIGTSAEGRSIFLVIISDNTSTAPKMSTMIEAGSNGSEWMTVSTALFLIQHLTKNQDLVKVMDYFIIPCSNPDAYECSLLNKESPQMDLSNNYPVTLGICDVKRLNTDNFLNKIKIWKENYKYNAPETLVLLKTILTYQFSVKLFISLRGDGTKISYPFGYCGSEVSGMIDLKKIAKSGRAGIKGRCFEVGTICETSGLTFGAIIDYLKSVQQAIQFVYIIHVNERCERDVKNIFYYGQDIMNCIKYMAKGVYVYYNKTEINNCNYF